MCGAALWCPADQTHQLALHLDLVGAEDAGLVGRVGGFQRDRGALACAGASAWLPRPSTRATTISPELAVSPRRMTT